ncbi:MAG: SUMF1/EgtB/PvdO family nonheme iron enzyme [Thermoanaerobaculia bacterium]
MGAVATSTDRVALLHRFRSGRMESRRFFDALPAGSYEERPIPLRHPFCFYEGHLAAFNVNTLLKLGLGQPGVDAGMEKLFERGIDPSDRKAAQEFENSGWPRRSSILAYVEAADAAVSLAIERTVREDFEGSERPAMRGGEALETILEHELMHQETLSYVAHRLSLARKQRPTTYPLEVGGEPPVPEEIAIPAGTATLGANRERVSFGWDNEFPENRVFVPAFRIDRFDVTNRDYLAFVEAGGYQDASLFTAQDWDFIHDEGITHPLLWERTSSGNGAPVFMWRGMYDAIPLPPAWPVWVSGAEAAAFARWKGRRLPTEAEFHRAAYGTPDGGPERSAPWGDAPAEPSRGNFGAARYEPVPVGARPRGRSAWGVDDLVGNGWEWTASVFAPFPGFTPMASYPLYSTDFFDGSHFVLKGASPATPVDLVRPGFRNWFRPNYPYLYASFRTAATT